MINNPYQFWLLYTQKLQTLSSVLNNSKSYKMLDLSGFYKFMTEANLTYWSQIFTNPEQLFTKQKDYFELFNSGASPDNSEYSKYFRSDMWESDPYFAWIKTLYIKTAEWFVETVDKDLLTHSEEDRKTIKFFIKQWIETFNPRNFPWSNPDIIKETMTTGGENLINGLDKLISDIQNGRISQCEASSFKLGENIACTPGQIVFRNKLMEIIQYSPQTDTVFATPLLIIPPWINKYYILDLSKNNSFINWLVAQGHSVFCISWANPDENFAEIGFSDYLKDGILQAFDIVQSITDQKHLNAIGYCLGGTLLAMALAWLDGYKKPNPVQSATFLTTLLDFDKAGDLKVFIDEEILSSLNKTLEINGVMDGKMMGMAFSLLRSSDLIWSFVINNYYMGRDPKAFDLLYWNSDCTNLPAAMYKDYIFSFYMKNALSQGSYELAGHRLDLRKIKTPAYFLSAEDDHIAPWEATKISNDIYGGESEFVLAKSGHIAGVINPPSQNKYGYYLDGKTVLGSWWPHWQKWMLSQGETRRIKSKKTLGNAQYPALENAPGRYVFQKI